MEKSPSNDDTRGELSMADLSDWLEKKELVLSVHKGRDGWAAMGTKTQDRRYGVLRSRVRPTLRNAIADIMWIAERYVVGEKVPFPPAEPFFAT